MPSTRDTSITQEASASSRPTVRSTSTSAASIASRPSASSDGLAAQVSALPEPVRLQMELIARASSSPDEALTAIIDLLVDGSAQKRAAIVTAYRTHDALGAQWERTYEILRS